MMGGLLFITLLLAIATLAQAEAEAGNRNNYNQYGNQQNKRQWPTAAELTQACSPEGLPVKVKGYNVFVNLYAYSNEAGRGSRFGHGPANIPYCNPWHGLNPRAPENRIDWGEFSITNLQFETPQIRPNGMLSIDTIRQGENFTEKVDQICHFAICFFGVFADPAQNGRKRVVFHAAYEKYAQMLYDVQTENAFQGHGMCTAVFTHMVDIVDLLLYDERNLQNPFVAPQNPTGQKLFKLEDDSAIMTHLQPGTAEYRNWANVKEERLIPMRKWFKEHGGGEVGVKTRHEGYSLEGWKENKDEFLAKMWKSPGSFCYCAPRAKYGTPSIQITTSTVGVEYTYFIGKRNQYGWSEELWAQMRAEELGQKPEMEDVWKRLGTGELVKVPQEVDHSTPQGVSERKQIAERKEPAIPAAVPSQPEFTKPMQQRTVPERHVGDQMFYVFLVLFAVVLGLIYFKLCKGKKKEDLIYARIGGDSGESENFELDNAADLGGNAVGRRSHPSGRVNLDDDY